MHIHVYRYEIPLSKMANPYVKRFAYHLNAPVQHRRSHRSCPRSGEPPQQLEQQLHRLHWHCPSSHSLSKMSAPKGNGSICMQSQESGCATCLLWAQNKKWLGHSFWKTFALYLFALYSSYFDIFSLIFHLLCITYLAAGISSFLSGPR